MLGQGLLRNKIAMVQAAISMFYAQFLNNPLAIGVPYFLLLGFNKGAHKDKGQNGATGEPSYKGIPVNNPNPISPKPL